MNFLTINLKAKEGDRVPHSRFFVLYKSDVKSIWLGHRSSKVLDNQVVVDENTLQPEIGPVNRTSLMILRPRVKGSWLPFRAFYVKMKIPVPGAKYSILQPRE